VMDAFSQPKMKYDPHSKAFAFSSDSKRPMNPPASGRCVPLGGMAIYMNDDDRRADGSMAWVCVHHIHIHPPLPKPRAADSYLTHTSIHPPPPKKMQRPHVPGAVPAGPAARPPPRAFHAPHPGPRPPGVFVLFCVLCVHACMVVCVFCRVCTCMVVRALCCVYIRIYDRRLLDTHVYITPTTTLPPQPIRLLTVAEARDDRLAAGHARGEDAARGHHAGGGGPLLPRGPHRCVTCTACHTTS
jgi:hypothetical protein